MARVYRAACRGDIEFADATKATFILTHIAKAIRDERELLVDELRQEKDFDVRRNEASEARIKFIEGLKQLTGGCSKPNHEL